MSHALGNQRSTSATPSAQLLPPFGVQLGLDNGTIQALHELPPEIRQQFTKAVNAAMGRIDLNVDEYTQRYNRQPSAL
jgi:hypothetical protein